jgi:hypothetical protein
MLRVGLAKESIVALERALEYCDADSERLKVLQRLAFAFEITGEWGRSKDALNTCMQFCEKTDPEHGKHNDYELLLLDARQRSAMDFLTLLQDSVECTESESATPSHRVGAAVIALKLAVDFGDQDVFDRVYENVRPFLNNEFVSQRCRLEISLIHTTTRSNKPVSTESLWAFAQVARESEGEIAYSRALAICASACRLTARYADGLEILSAAIAHANSLHLQQRVWELKLALVNLHISAANYRAATNVLAEVEELVDPSDNVKARFEILCNKTRIAFETGQLLEAVRTYNELEPSSPTYSVCRKGYRLALEIRVHLVQGIVNERLRGLVQELEKAHLTMRAWGPQDFEVHALYLGLVGVGCKPRANQLLRDYVHLHRKEPWPLPSCIALAAQLGSAKESREVPALT